MARADVKGIETGQIQNREIGCNDISDVNVVARLAPVSIDSGCLVCDQPLEKNGHDAGFSMRVLPLPVDVGISQAGRIESVLSVEVVEVVFTGQLGDTVG